MRFPRSVILGWSLLLALTWVGAPSYAQRGGMFQGSADDPGIRYSAGPLDNVVDKLNGRLEAGTARLSFQGRSGYLQSLLGALGIPIDSQMLLFSRASLQGRLVNQNNPRALFFKDDVEVGWVRDGDLIELAAQDAKQGVVFYTLEQKDAAAPRLQRKTICLGCHMTGDTFGVPGLLMFSATPDSDREFGASVFTDHSTPIARRFGGWFVTGAATPASHKGNAVAALEGRPSRALTSTEGLYDADGYPASSSDIASLMVFSHQAHMINLLIRAGWEARVADPALHPGTPPGNESLVATVLHNLAREVVDSLLFVDEAPLDAPVQGRSGFAERFSAEGIKDPSGRSLRQLDLKRRLQRYPCSYLIYSPVFDALPPSIKNPIYERMWQVLSGAEKDARYRSALPLADRQAVVDILRQTKPGLPSYFKPVTQ